MKVTRTTRSKNPSTKRRPRHAPEARPIQPPATVQGPARQRRPTLEDVRAGLRFLETAPIPQLPEEVREREVRRRLRRQLDAVEQTIWYGAEGSARLPRLKALNVVHAVNLALQRGVSDSRLDALDHAACRLIDALDEPVPAPRKGRLSKENLPSGEKRLFLDRVDLALELARVPREHRRDGRVERREIEAQWRARDDDAPDEDASSIAGVAVWCVGELLLRETTRPVPVESVALDRDVRAVARAVAHLLRTAVASPQNVALFALHYFGMPRKLHKNFFKGVEDEWDKGRKEFGARMASSSCAWPSRTGRAERQRPLSRDPSVPLPCGTLPSCPTVRPPPVHPAAGPRTRFGPSPSPPRWTRARRSGG